MTQQLIRSVFTQGINLTSATTWTVSDQAGVRTVTFNPGGTSLWYRVLITPSGGTGTEALPLDLASHVKTQLNTIFGGPQLWRVSIDANGFFEFSYTGTGTAAVTAIDAAVAPCLGVTTTFGGLTNGGAAFIAPYHPTHVVYASSRTNDTDWIPRADTIVGARLEDGTSDVLRSGITGATRKFTFFAHPRDWATRTARSAGPTPFYSDESQWLSTHLDTASLAPPWSLQRFIHSATGRRLGVCFDFQSAIIGGGPRFYDCTLDFETALAKDPSEDTVMYSPDLLNWKDVTLRFAGLIT